MKVSHLALALAVLAWTASASATERKIHKVKPVDFVKLTSSTVRSSDEFVAMSAIQDPREWTANFGAEAKLLALFPGYTGAVYFKRNQAGQIESSPEDLMYYLSSTQTVLRQQPTGLNLKDLLRYERIKSLQPEMKFAPTPITAEQIVAVQLRDKKPITAFAWTNGKVNPAKNEINLDRTIPSPGSREMWCSRPERATCFEAYVGYAERKASTFKDTVLGIGATVGETAKDVVDNAKDESDGKDRVEGVQAELRVLESEADGGYAEGSLKAITHVDSKVVGIVELTFFYLNRAIEYGKFVTVLQVDPANPNQTIMTNVMLTAVKMHSWKAKKYGVVVEEFLRGISMFNMSTGLFAGVPKFTQEYSQTLARTLEGTRGT